jgi:hypothetical protein
MRWLHAPDRVSVFGHGAAYCEDYQGPCDCYCPPKFVKLEIWGPPIPLP